tara:strand:+ start:393 stop:515 length:123 start_codon:yes stop_codon:yes gene_type:complete
MIKNNGLRNLRQCASSLYIDKDQLAQKAPLIDSYLYSAAE